MRLMTINGSSVMMEAKYLKKSNSNATVEELINKNPQEYRKIGQGIRSFHKGDVFLK